MAYAPFSCHKPVLLFLHKLTNYLALDSDIDSGGKSLLAKISSYL
jgi:hypothetical protein